ncbi:MAG: D-2-hydroxyacid dehydrogenase [Gammaproteobacteria bacterium]|nr:MAG: D-2-hydroxyacid dehydrogenase [Gammaproteobacteria bacterium]
MRAVFLDTGTLGEDISLAALEDLPLQWEWFEATAPHEVLTRIAGASVVATNKVVLDAGHLDQAKALRLIAVAATGTNNIDLEAARLRNIRVRNVTDYATPSVVQHVFMLILALQGRLNEVHSAIQAGAWQQARFFSLLDFPFAELSGRTLGILGYGVLGQAVAQIARSFGMHVRLARLPGRPDSSNREPLETILADADVITLHCPLTSQTRGMIGEEALKRMKPTALLINTARGGIVDELALAKALQQGWIAGAGLDVLTTEPPLDNPLLELQHPRLIVTPHVAWASRESRQRLVDKLAQQILEALSESRFEG